MLSVRREDKRPLDCALFFPYFSKLTWNFFKPTSFSNLPIPSNQYKLVLNHFKPIQVNTKSSIPIKVHQINRAHSKMRSKSKKPIQINANSSKIHSNVSSQYNLTQNSVQSPKTRSSPIISIQNHKVPFKHVKPIHSHPKIRSSLDKQVKSYSNLSNQYKLIPKCIQSPKFRSKSKIPFKAQNPFMLLTNPYEFHKTHQKCVQGLPKSIQPRSQAVQKIKGSKTTAPRIPAWSPTVVLTGRHSG